MQLLFKGYSLGLQLWWQQHQYRQQVTRWVRQKASTAYATAMGNEQHSQFLKGGAFGNT
jgi:hypothetical protein